MMSFVLCVLAMALASSSSSSLHPSESVRNQYGPRDALAEATDHPPEAKKQVVPELQVGCADGNIQEKRQEQQIDRNSPKINVDRIKRSYYPWSGQLSYSVPYQSISVWKPPAYALERPYYIPIFGVAGRPPIYFPPQPLPHNPGVPKDNPNKYQGPQYLPPRETSTQMSLNDRFNGGDNYDDRPIWDLGGEEPTTRAPSGSIIPTRAPRPPPEAVTPPPLIHGSPSGSGSSGSSPSFNNEVEDLPLRPPPPPSRPAPTRRPSATTTRRPEPTRCVWAIISCCSSSARDISYDCFEERGCPGAFWDASPCDSEFAKAAIAAALNYYN